MVKLDASRDHEEAIVFRLNTKRRVKLAALFGLGLLLITTLFTIGVPPASGYEISLYDAYPIIFWVFVVGTFFMSHLVIIASAKIPEDRTWIAGLGQVLLLNTLLLLMPYIRGYPMWGRDDALSHLGFILDISTLGGVSGANIYPNLHVVARTLSYATGLEVMSVLNLIQPVFSLVFFGALYLILKQVLDSRERVLFGLPFVTLPVLGQAHINPRPFDAAIMLIPLVLYLLVKTGEDATPSVRAAFVIAIVGSFTYHPLMPVFLLPMFLVWFFADYVPYVGRERSTPMTVVLLPFVVAVAWYQKFVGIIVRFERVYNVLVGFEGEGSPLSSYSETVSRTSPRLVDVLQIATITYGLDGVLFALGFAALGSTLLFQSEMDRAQILFGAMLTVFSFGGLSFLVLDLIVPPERPFQVAKIAAILLAGGAFYVIWDEKVRNYHAELRDTFDVAFAAVLVVLIVLATFSLYPSPLGAENNPQVAEMELEGSAWLVEHREPEPETGVQQIGINYERLYHGQYGTLSWRNTMYGEGSTVPPPRFNYTTYGTLGQNYDQDKYLLVSEGGRVTYQVTFPDYREFWRYTPENYERIERDSTVARVYANGDLETYRINATGGQEVVADVTEN